MARDIHFENSIVYLIPNAVILCHFFLRDFLLQRAAQLSTVARTPASASSQPIIRPASPFLLSRPYLFDRLKKKTRFYCVVALVLSVLRTP